MRVLKGALSSVSPGGHIFFGDVRSLPLLEAYHTSVEMFKGGASQTPDALRTKVKQAMKSEEELVIDPRFFTAARTVCNEIGHIQIKPKRGEGNNELIRYRYDVILHVGEQQREAEGIRRVDWNNIDHTLTGISSLLVENQ